MIYFIMQTSGEDTVPYWTDANLPLRMLTSSFNFLDYSCPAYFTAFVEAPLLSTALLIPLNNLLLMTCCKSDAHWKLLLVGMQLAKEDQSGTLDGTH